MYGKPPVLEFMLQELQSSMRKSFTIQELCWALLQEHRTLKTRTGRFEIMCIVYIIELKHAQNANATC